MKTTQTQQGLAWHTRAQFKFEIKAFSANRLNFLIDVRAEPRTSRRR
jgi:hypothetical protein